MLVPEFHFRIVQFRLGLELGLSGLRIDHFEDFEVLVGHGFGDGRRSSFFFCECSKQCAGVAEHFFGCPLEGSVLGFDGCCVADSSVGVHVDFVAAQRDDCGTADGFTRDPGNGADAVLLQGRDVVGHGFGCSEQSTGRVDFDDDDVDVFGSSPSELLVEEVLHQGLDHAFDPDQQHFGCSGGLGLFSHGDGRQSVDRGDVGPGFGGLADQQVHRPGLFAEENALVAGVLDAVGFDRRTRHVLLQQFQFARPDHSEPDLLVFGRDGRLDQFGISIEHGSSQGPIDLGVVTFLDQRSDELPVGVVERFAAADVSEAGVGCHHDVIAGECHHSDRTGDFLRNPRHGSDSSQLRRTQELRQSLHLVEGTFAGCQLEQQHRRTVFLFAADCQVLGHVANSADHRVVDRAANGDELAQRLGGNILLCNSVCRRRDQQDGDRRELPERIEDVDHRWHSNEA